MRTGWIRPADFTQVIPSGWAPRGRGERRSSTDGSDRTGRRRGSRLARPGARGRVGALRRRPAHGARHRRGGAAARGARPEPARRGAAGAGLEGVPAPVPGPDAARAAGRRDRQHRRAAGVQHRHRDHRPDRAQRGPGAEPGGQGRRERRGAAEDARHPRARAPQRREARHPLGGARPGRRRDLRGRRPRAGGRPAAGRRDPGDRGGRADRREHAGAEGRRRGGGRRRPARRPPGHGVHELDRDPRARGDGRDGDRHEHRDRPDLAAC